MAQLHTLSITITTPPNISSTSFPTLFPSTRKSTSLFFHNTLQFHIIRCSCSSPASNSILTVETRNEDEGVDDENEVSSTRLLAQNLPWSSTPAHVRELFQQYGSVVAVELSMHNKTRNRGLAFIEMGSAEEAAEAFAKLESFEFEGRTLKLAYAKPKKKKASPPAPFKPPVVYNLFVANLPFEARAKDLKAFFQSGGSHPVSAEVIFYENPRKSAGYGFVSFQTKREADEALSGFEGKELLGRPIRVARSNRFVKLETEMNPQSEEEQDLSTDSSQGSD